MARVKLVVLVIAAALLAVAAVGWGSPAAGARETSQELALEVRETEIAFAKTMADRDHAAFVSFIADEAVFFGSKSVLRGKAAVAAGWRPLFEDPVAPFSWEPERVEVLDSGNLALSTGPIKDSEGRDAGSFMSIWRRGEGGRWSIVFDKGCPPTDSGQKEIEMQEIHKQLSVKCFNECWSLIDKQERTPEEVENMILLAYTSLWHWKQRTDQKPVNLSVGYWQVSRVHALAGQYEMARLFGQKCLETGRDNKLPPFYLGYGHEALARAEIVRGNFDEAKVHLAEARRELNAVTDEEERAVLEPDIAALEKMVPSK